MPCLLDAGWTTTHAHYATCCMFGAWAAAPLSGHKLMRGSTHLEQQCHDQGSCNHHQLLPPRATHGGGAGTCCWSLPRSELLLPLSRIQDTPLRYRQPVVRLYRLLVVQLGWAPAERDGGITFRALECTQGL
jgi:hypothetical protein